MKQNVAQSNQLFVDRQIISKALNNPVPSLWSISASHADYADTILRFFLVVCLLSSLVLCGLRVNKNANPTPSSDLGLSVKTLAVEPVLPSFHFGVSAR